MRRILFLLVMLNIVCLMYAQTIRDAERLYNDKKYDEAINIYEGLLKKNPKDYVLKCKVGHCLVDMGRYEEAIPLLESAVSKKMKRAYLYLYDAYFYTYEFDKAIDALNHFLESSEGVYMDDTQTKDMIKRAELGSNMLNRVEDVAIIDSFKIVKSELLNVYDLSSDVGKLEIRDGENTEQQEMVYYTGRKDKKILSKRMGSNEQLDLRVAYNLLEQWSAETDLSTVINTNEDENYPFELQDGVTLYFASKGHSTLGGYDIFLTRYNSNTNRYSDPINVGMPFNSIANDYMLVIDEMAGIGWFATDRNQKGDTVAVYSFIPNQEKILIKSDDPKYKKEAAQLKRYRIGESVSKHKSVTFDSTEESDTDINFMVNDGILYTKIDQFVSQEARAYYLKLYSAEQRLTTLERLIEGKRTEFSFSTIEKDKEILRNEIISMENEIIKYKELVKEYLFNTRKAELQALKK